MTVPLRLSALVLAGVDFRQLHPSLGVAHVAEQLGVNSLVRPVPVDLGLLDACNLSPDPNRNR